MTGGINWAEDYAAEDYAAEVRSGRYRPTDGDQSKSGLWQHADDVKA